MAQARRGIAAVVAVILACGWYGTAFAASPASAEADTILGQAGVSGGLIVFVTGADIDGKAIGQVAAALGRSGRYVVRVLVPKEQALAAVRAGIKSAGAYGRVSAGLWDGRSLPLRDNLANVIACGAGAGVSEAEAMRVLAPRGVWLAVKGGAWAKHVKPRPANIDEWTHFLHGPDNNAVAADRVVGPPTRLQWLADPIHLRSHEHLNSISAVVSAGGRIFTIIDEGPVSTVVARSDWKLVARDAFNGLLLWKRGLGPWEGHWRLFRSGPPEIARRLVAVGREVYVTTGYGKTVAAFDAATGKPLRTYQATRGAVEILCDAGRLFVVTGQIPKVKPDPLRPFTATRVPRNKGLVVVDAKTGKVVWQRKDKDTDAIMPTTLAVADGHVFFQNTREILCLNADTGKELWRAPRPVYTTRLSWSAPTLVVKDGVVLSADGTAGKLPKAPRGADRVTWIASDTDIRTHPKGDLVALDAKTGRTLWTGESLQGFCNPGDLFVIGGRVWAGANVASRQMALTTVVDLHTGKVVSRMPKTRLPVGGHTRCYRDKATERYLVLGGSGVEFVSAKDWSWQANPWVRGTCQYGVMPCNGLLYSPPDSCACRPEMRLHGFAAMAPEKGPSSARSAKAKAAGKGPVMLVKGPAYLRSVQAPQRGLPSGARPLDGKRGKSSNPQSAIPNPQSDAWPTYRHDGARSGCTSAAAPVSLGRAWRTEIGGKLTSVTAADGKVFVSRVDAHTVYALDGASGKILWQRTVGAGVDSPPTFCDGRVLFGCRDGWVTCLRAADGELVWRLRAAPEDRSIVAMEAVESAWPVHGSVLVKGGVAWFVAGRSPYLDGGMRLWAVDVATGKPVVHRALRAPGDTQFRQAGGKPSAGVVDTTPPMLPDILSASGGLVYMRWMGFDAKGQVSQAVKPHLFSATGFLDDTWWHRTYWQYGTWMRGGFGGWPQAARATAAGRLMAIAPATTDAAGPTLYGFGRTQYDPGNPNNVYAGHVGLVKDTYQDEGHIDYARNPYRLYRARIAQSRQPGKRPGRGRTRRTVENEWQVSLPMLVRAMAVAGCSKNVPHGTALLVAGPLAGKNDQGLAHVRDVQSGMLWSVSPKDGKKLTSCDLPSAPIQDGLAVIPGRILIACVDGSVCCLGGNAK